MKILAIESSCDETAAAVTEGREVLSNIVATQIAEHKIYGGVVPEIASRRHTEAISAVADEALKAANIGYNDIDAVAVTFAPGLIGALLVGVNFAKGLAMALNKPLIPVHHLRSHIAANYITHPELKPPFLCLLVSGGNTVLAEVTDYTKFKIIGETQDDAAGECMDKAARCLGLSYPGGVNLGETHWATIVVFIAAYLVAGYDVLWRAICNIRHGEVFDENFLMTVASVGAMCVAEYAEGVAVMVLYQIGEYFQDKAVDKSRESITKLMDIRPDYANLVDGNDSRRVSPERVRVGDIILVKPGEKIPLDGVVIEGNSSLNTTALTGESLPRDVKEGDQVLSGCVNLSGVVKVKVTVGYGESTVAKILALVESSGDAKAKTERFITKFSRIYTPAVCFFALALAIIPSLFDGNWTNWIYTALTFLVISCPCALVISVPLTFFSGIGGASKKGILIKGATYLETLAGLDTVVFDKTGTLTKGTFSVTGVHPAKSVTKDELLDAAAHAEAFSDHPIGSFETGAAAETAGRP